MASRKRLPKPEGESECSRRTATVPVTCFIDVKRNATTKRVTRELVAVVFGCGVLMRGLRRASQTENPVPFAKRRGRDVDPGGS